MNYYVYWIHLQEHTKQNWNPNLDQKWFDWASKQKLNKGNTL